ESDPIVAQY
nr:Chain C, Titin [Homo sapiens]